jgi:Protein of unknown function (DUF3570)
MQLKWRTPSGAVGVRRMLATAATGLLASSQGHGQDASADNPDAPTATVDAAVLYYQESGRVQAIEPALNVTQQIGDDSVLSFGLTADAVSGPTPLGAVPSTLPQTYVRPYKVIPLGTAVTVSTASGGSVVQIIPPATGATTQTLAATTIVPPNTYPLDRGFSDRRYAGHAGWEQALNSTLKINGGIAYSTEHDYRSESANLALSQDFNSHNTTLSAGVNFESDLSFPIGGTPTPLSVMSGAWKGPDAERREVDAVVGLTQVLTRRWLSTLSYSYASAHGYQNDPYKIVSMVDPVSGQPVSQLYESRPDERRKQSLYFDNKIHLARDIVEVGLRGYEDDWGVRSVTADLGYRYQITPTVYLEPQLRYYRQGAADFFQYYLVAGEPLPQYATADTRLARFQAYTYGMKFGMHLNEGSEFNVRVGYYQQRGNGSPSYAIGQLRQQNLFPNLDAVVVTFGYSYAF